MFQLAAFSCQILSQFYSFYSYQGIFVDFQNLLKNINNTTVFFHLKACADCRYLTPKCNGLTQDIILSIGGILNNIFLIFQSCLDEKKEDALLENISSFRENTEVKELKQEIEGVRANSNDNNSSIIIRNIKC